MIKKYHFQRVYKKYPTPLVQILMTLNISDIKGTGHITLKEGMVVSIQSVDYPALQTTAKLIF